MKAKLALLSITMRLLFVIAIQACVLSSPSSSSYTEGGQGTQTVLKTGEPDLVYRIPQIANVAGTLVVLAEGRPSESDLGNIDIVTRVSHDRGVTWGPLQRVCDVAGTCGNPTPISDGNVLHLLAAQNDLGGYDNAVQRTLHYSRWRISGDQLENMVSWRQLDPEATQRPDTVWDAVGPAPGVIWRADGVRQLIAPANGRILISENDGLSWYYQDVPDVNGESSIAILGSTLHRVARQTEDWNNWPIARFEHMMTSAQFVQGEWKWEEFSHQKDLPTPGHYCDLCSEDARTCNECSAHCVHQGLALEECPYRAYFVQSTLIEANDSLYFISPASTRSRKKLTLYRGDGSSWEVARIIDSGYAGYSGAAVQGDRLFVVYETPEFGGHSIRLVSFPLDSI